MNFVFLFQKFNKIHIYIFHKAPLHIAVENNDIGIVVLLLNHSHIDVNNICIIIRNFFEVSNFYQKVKILLKTEFS